MCVFGLNLFFSHLVLFCVSQGRLGPGRLHHCMRLLGAGQRALALATRRASSRVVFGAPLSSQGAFRAKLAACRLALEQARLMTLVRGCAMDDVTLGFVFKSF